LLGGKAVEITASAELVAEDMSDVSWEDLIDMYASRGTSARPSAYVAEPCVGGCDCDVDAGLHTDSDTTPD
jgi:hypothetical protein